MNLLGDFSDENWLRRLFTWQTKADIAPQFGSRPIGWYQMHQCHALDELKRLCVAMGADAGNVRRKGWTIQAKVWRKWLTLATAREIYDKADALCRK